MENIKLNVEGKETKAYKRKNKTAYEIIKRLLDIMGSLLASLILLIPGLIIAIVIFAVAPGNPLFIQERVGKNGKRIKIFKFRSMIQNADDLEKMLTPEQYQQYLKEFKLDNDPRLLPHKIGYYIRRLSIDELPQIFFNILLKGDMSIVGPRPILEEELHKNYTPEEQRLLLSVKPGLTGYWQAYGRNRVGYESGKRQKMELHYAQNCGLLFDFRIILKSFVAVAKRDGAK